jgi:hypothetical protein
MPGGGRFGLKSEVKICLNAWIYNQIFICWNEMNMQSKLLFSDLIAAVSKALAHARVKRVGLVQVA